MKKFGRHKTAHAPVDYRIPKVLGYIMILVAVMADAVQALLKFLWFTVILIILAEGLGWLITGFIVTVYAIIFASLGVNFLMGQRIAMKMARFLFMFLAEFIPFLNAIPSLTIWTMLTIRESHKEDKERSEEKAKKQELENAKIQKRRMLRFRRHQESQPSREELAHMARQAVNDNNRQLSRVA